MKIATGKVVGGLVVVEGANLEEGSVVTVLARDNDETFELTSDQEADLLAAIVEAERGDVVSSERLLGKLPRRN